MKELKNKDSKNLVSKIPQNSQEKVFDGPSHLNRCSWLILKKEMQQACHVFHGAVDFCSFLFTFRGNRQRCSIKKLFLKNSQQSKENTFLFNRVADL